MWFAVTRTAPDGVQAVGEDPIRAMTASPLLKRSATTGVIALPPSVPPSASVVQQRRLVALTVTLLPPIIVTPSWISARVSVGLYLLTATEAPRPNFSPSPFAFAFAELFSAWLAVIWTSPVPALTVLPVRIRARVLTVIALMASAPAKPKFSAPDPEVALASSVCTRSPGGPRIAAPRSRPILVTVALVPMIASVVISTSLNTTAAPMPVVLSVAEPSAVALESTSPSARSLSAAPDTTMRPAPRLTRMSAFVIANVIAAATESDEPPFSPVPAVCVVFDPEPWPPFAAAWPLPCARCELAVWFTFWPELFVPPVPSPSAPAAVAVADVVFADAPDAVTEIAPVAFTFRSRTAMTSYVAELTARAMPQALFEPFDSPVAVVFAVVC